MTDFAIKHYTKDYDNADAVEIQISNVTPYFSFLATLSEEVFRFVFKYNDRAEKWAMSVYNQNNEAIFEGVFCVAGINYIDYIYSEKWPDDAISLIFYDDKRWTTEPTFDNLGKEVKLYYLSAPEEVENTITVAMTVL
jgi:hypothetical protein